MRRAAWMAVGALLAGGWAHAVLACPGCKDALVDPAQVGTRLGMARGFAWSIGLLLAMPATLIGAVTLRVVWAARQRKEG